MLSLRRTQGQGIVLEIPENCPPGTIWVWVHRLEGNQVQLALDAPRNVHIVREEKLNEPRQAAE